MDDTETSAERSKRLRTRNLKQLPFLLVWMAIVFWFMTEADFPDSFGLRIPGGRGGALEDYWYSYLLLRRHQFWDIALFVALWAPVIGLLGWVAWQALRHRRAKFRIFADEEGPTDRSA